MRIILSALMVLCLQFSLFGQSSPFQLVESAYKKAQTSEDSVAKAEIWGNLITTFHKDETLDYFLSSDLRHFALLQLDRVVRIDMPYMNRPDKIPVMEKWLYFELNEARSLGQEDLHIGITSYLYSLPRDHAWIRARMEELYWAELYRWGLALLDQLMEDSRDKPQQQAEILLTKAEVLASINDKNAAKEALAAAQAKGLKNQGLAGKIIARLQAYFKGTEVYFTPSDKTGEKPWH